MALDRIGVPKMDIERLCRQYHVRRLAIFGSMIHKDSRPDSDVDVLVEFEPDAQIGLDFFILQDDLSRQFGRTVDLHTPASLSRYFRDSVLAEAEDQYVALR